MWFDIIVYPEHSGPGLNSHDAWVILEILNGDYGGCKERKKEISYGDCGSAYHNQKDSLPLHMTLLEVDAKVFSP